MEQRVEQAQEDENTTQNIADRKDQTTGQADEDAEEARRIEQKKKKNA